MENDNKSLMYFLVKCGVYCCIFEGLNSTQDGLRARNVWEYFRMRHLCLNDFHLNIPSMNIIALYFISPVYIPLSAESYFEATST